MKLLAEGDKKYKKIQKREQKGVKDARHRTTMRPHRGTMDMYGK
jgi:cytidylate kinase